VARRYLARHSQGADAQQQAILFIDESGCYPLPSVVRTYAPIGQTPILREWCTRDHLSAISAISPEGKLYFHYQDRAINSADVVAFLEHLLREVPGRMLIIWDGAPIHRSHVIQEFLANGAAQRLHLERLPAYAPELNPGEGLWPNMAKTSLTSVGNSADSRLTADVTPCMAMLNAGAELRATRASVLAVSSSAGFGAVTRGDRPASASVVAR
jgi:transposase